MDPSKALPHALLFERAPILGAVFDDELRIVEANERFRRVFPEWQGRHCFEVLFGRASRCSSCPALRSLQDGRTRVVEEHLPLAGGADATFITRVAPLRATGDQGSHVIWLGSAIDEAESLLRENEFLFEHAPGYVAVLDRELRIVRANERMKRTFGARRGEFCYRVCKGRNDPCDDCPALLAFADGQEHTARQALVTSEGVQRQCLTTAAPLSVVDSEACDARAHRVIEMSVDLVGAPEE